MAKNHQKRPQNLSTPEFRLCVPSPWAAISRTASFLQHDSDCCRCTIPSVTKLALSAFTCFNTVLLNFQVTLQASCNLWGHRRWSKGCLCFLWNIERVSNLFKRFQGPPLSPHLLRMTHDCRSPIARVRGSRTKTWPNADPAWFKSCEVFRKLKSWTTCQTNSFDVLNIITFCRFFLFPLSCSVLQFRRFLIRQLSRRFALGQSSGHHCVLRSSLRPQSHSFGFFCEHFDPMESIVG